MSKLKEGMSNEDYQKIASWIGYSNPKSVSIFSAGITGRFGIKSIKNFSKNGFFVQLASGGEFQFMGAVQTVSEEVNGDILTVLIDSGDGYYSVHLEA